MAELFFEDERMGIQDPIFNNQLQNEAFSDLRYQDMGGVHGPAIHSRYGLPALSTQSYHPSVDQTPWRENIDINRLSTYPEPWSPYQANMRDISGEVGEYGQIPGQGNVDMFTPEKRGFPFSGIFAGLADKFRREPNPILEAEMAALKRNRGYLDTGEYVERQGDRGSIYDYITTPEGTERVRVTSGKNLPGTSAFGSKTFEEQLDKQEEWVAKRLLAGKRVSTDLLRWYRNRTGTSDRFTETEELIQAPRPDAGGAVTTGGGGEFSPTYDRAPPGARPSWHEATAARGRAGKQVAGPGFGQGAYWAQGGRVGYQDGELVEEDVNIEGPGYDENILEIMKGEGVPFGEQVQGEGDILSMLIAKYLEAGFPPDQAQTMAMQELQQMVAESGQGEGLASLV